MPEHLDRLMRLGIAAHEDVDRDVGAFRPGLDGDMAFREHGHAGDTSIRREAMEVDIDERRAGRLHGAAQRRLDLTKAGRCQWSIMRCVPAKRSPSRSTKWSRSWTVSLGTTRSAAHGLTRSAWCEGPFR